MAEVNRFPTCFRRPSAGGGPVAVCADVEIPSDCSRPRADNSVSFRRACNRTPVSYAAGAGPQGISVADVNGDGAQDLVVADASGSAVATIFRTGDGRFTTGTAVDVGGFPRTLVAGDFNGACP